MINLKKCNIDLIGLTDISLTNYAPLRSESFSYIKMEAKFAYFVDSRPVGQISVEGLDEDDEVAEAIANLISALEKAYVSTIGSTELKEAPEDPPKGILDKEF